MVIPITTRYIEVTKMNEEARPVGMKINKGKTKVMRINGKSQEKVAVHGQDIGEIEEFNYLGATICKEEEELKI